MELKKSFVFFIFGLVPFIAVGQQDWEDSYNRLGLKAGANYFNIITEDLQVTPKVSWTAGFTTRSSYYENFQFIYGISFYDLNVNITGREKLLSTKSEEVRFNMIAVQGSFLGSIKLFDHHLSVEAGPIIQVNGKLEPQQNKEYFYIQDYDFQAIDMEDINKLNFNLAIGISGGFEKIKFWTQYQMGLNNMLNKLNNGGLSEIDPTATNFQGNIRMITGGIVFFL